jgi:hypothetical protein
VKLFRILGPAVLVQQLLQPRQPDLKGAMKQDRQFSWVHQMILGAVSK